MPEYPTYHVIPIDDLREHEASVKCWCNPVMDDDECDLYIHHALDQRDKYEHPGSFH